MDGSGRVAEQMIAAARLAELPPLPRDEALSDNDRWKACEPFWPLFGNDA